MTLTALLAGCAGDLGVDSKSYNPFVKPEWATFSSPKDVGTLRAIEPSDLVGVDGRCTGGATVTPVAVAADGAAPSTGGVALTMTECEVANRAGQPEKVDLGTNAGGERTLVLTYPRGPWPGIYRFAGGRLNEVERVAEPAPAPKPARPARKKTPRTAAAEQAR